MYTALAERLIAGGIITDPWVYGAERFRLEPMVLSPDLYQRMCSAGERVARLFNSVCTLVAAHPDLLDELSLTPYQLTMWESAVGRWHGIARIDFFVLTDGTLRFCEVNSDTPSGEAETVVLNAVCHPDHPHLVDPNREFEEHFVEMVLASHRASHRAPREHPAVGIVYPTDLPEDLSMIALYRSWFERRGMRVVIGSPYNLQPRSDGGVGLFDVPVEIIVRHYKTDWWGERLPVWSDQPDYPDPDPLDPPLGWLLAAESVGAVTVVNPFGAVVSQNKRAMALCWEHLDLFDAFDQETIRALLPETRRLEVLDPATLRREEWVLKSDYGCEGDEVTVGRHVSDEVWEIALERAIPGHWVAQRWFDAAPLEDGAIPNYGLYIIAGRAAGIFTRLSPRSTDATALVPATFLGGD